MFVRLGLEQDIDVIIELARMNSALSTPHLTFSEEQMRKTYRAYLDECRTTFWLVEDNREVIAFLVMSINEYWHVAGLFTTQEVLFVRPDKRGTRAAALLMRHLIAESERLGAIEITGGNDNKFKSEKMARYLGRFGFEQVGFFMRRVMANG